MSSGGVLARLEEKIKKRIQETNEIDSSKVIIPPIRGSNQESQQTTIDLDFNGFAKGNVNNSASKLNLTATQSPSKPIENQTQTTNNSQTTQSQNEKKSLKSKSEEKQEQPSQSKSTQQTTPTTTTTKPTSSNPIDIQSKQQQAIAEKNKGNDFFKQSNFAKAVEHYSASIKLDPTQPISFANRSMAYLSLKNYIDAETDASKAIELDANYIKSYARRGIARKMQSKFKEALLDFETVLKLEPSNQQALEELKSIQSSLLTSIQSSKAKATPTLSTSTPTSTPTPSPSPIPTPTLPPVPKVTTTPTPTPIPTPIPTPTPTPTPKATVTQSIPTLPKTTTITPTPTPSPTPTITPTPAQTAPKKVIDVLESKQTSPLDNIPSKRRKKILIEEISSSSDFTSNIQTQPNSQSTAQSTATTTTTTTTPTTTTANKKIESTNSSTLSPIQIASASLMASSVSIPNDPPKNSFEFESQWNVYKQNPQSFASYLKIIPPQKLATILGASLTDAILSSIISAFEFYDINSELTQLLEFMENLLLVDRIDMHLMFLEEKERQSIEKTFKKLSSLQTPNSQSARVSTLKQKFGIN